MKKEKTDEIPSFVEQIKEDEAKIRREAEALEREMSERLKLKTAELEEARTARRVAETVLAAMKRNYAEVEALAYAQELKGLSSTGAIKADVLTGKISAEEYLRDGVTPEEAGRRATETARERLAGLAAEVRRKALEVMDLEIAERSVEMDVYYLSTYPGQNELAQLKELTKTLEDRVNGRLAGSPEARTRLERLKRIKTGFDQGNQWFNMDESAVRDLRFDPEFPEKLVPKLEAIIRDIAGTGKKYRIMWGRGDVTYFEE